nr:hypothetical protein [Bacteroidota bacterium]
MNKYNPNFHHRRSIRLKGYDYSQAGLYFITICVKDRACLFGEIKNGEMILNDAGEMVEKWYFELENKYPDKKCHEMVVMPNHFHCIIENAPLTDEMPTMDNTPAMDAHVGTSLRGRPQNDGRNEIDGNKQQSTDSPYGMDNQKYNVTIGDAMDWFKTMTTNEYIRGVKNNNWQRFKQKLWHRNYWEHIIRNEQSYNRISEYIINNPKNWKDDKFYE